MPSTPDSKKRTLDGFFAPSSKKPRVSSSTEDSNEKANGEASAHPTYPFPIPHLRTEIASSIAALPVKPGKAMDDQADLDLLYYQPYVPKSIENELFQFLRSQLFFYRVEYRIKRGGFETHIRTPRFTTVFGIDETARFDPDGNPVTTATRKPIVDDPHYAACAPRPIPQCLDVLRQSTEAATGCKFNFCLVNYYASGADSISYHSDDERFLGPLPAIASFTLGARRDFLLKHKPVPAGTTHIEGKPVESTPLKLPLASGDMILMRGRTQANWLHSIPKRAGKNAEGGRINITFRKALVRGGTENYYRYNVGTGPVFRWCEKAGEMKLWTKAEK